MKVHYHKVPKQVKREERTRTIRMVAILIAAIMILLVVYVVRDSGPKTPEPGECTAEGCPTPLKSVSLSTDKGVYRSREFLKADITIESEIDQSADISLHGVNAKGYDRVKLNTTQELGKGRNIISMSYGLPSCTGCSGISPGNYTLTADVKTADETKTANLIIEIRQ